MRWWKKPKWDESKLVAEIAGTKIYGWPAVERMPTRRYLAYFLAANEAELGISREDIMALVKGIRDSYQAGAHTKVGWYAETLLFYMEAYPPEKVIFKMIAPVVRLEGEPEGELLEEWTKKKADLYEKDPDMRRFFLSYGHDTLKASGHLSGDIQKRDFLNLAEAPGERIFSQLIGKSTYRDYLSE